MNGSPVPLLLLVLSVVGLIADYRYKKAGGRPSSKRDKTIFLVVLLLVAGFFVLLAVLPNGDDLHDPFRLERLEGQFVIPVALWLFAAWELGRWRMRRKYPLAKPEEPKTPDAT